MQAYVAGEIIDNKFYWERYLSDLKLGKFRNEFNFGFSPERDEFQLQNMLTDPHALFVGSMDTGKSWSCRFSLLTWLLANSDRTEITIVNTLNEPEEYQVFKDLPQVKISHQSKDLVDEINTLADEVSARINAFSKQQVKNIDEFESKMNQKITRKILVLDDASRFLHQLEEFPTAEWSISSKVNKIMRQGQVTGIWVVFVTSRATTNDVPLPLLSMIANRNVFLCSMGESHYLIGNDNAAKMLSRVPGRCFSGKGYGEFPKWGEVEISKLLEEHMKPLSSKNLFQGKTNLWQEF